MCLTLGCNPQIHFWHIFRRLNLDNVGFVSTEVYRHWYVENATPTILAVSC